MDVDRTLMLLERCLNGDWVGKVRFRVPAERDGETTVCALRGLRKAPLATAGKQPPSMHSSAADDNASMPLVNITAADAIQQLGSFDTLIDARSESEYAQDRVPGAVNWPSLTDDERKLVGTEYKQVSPFVAKKRGAALVARNIARHIEREVLD